MSLSTIWVHAEAEVLERRMSTRSPNRGYLGIRVVTSAGDDALASFVCTMLVPARGEASPLGAEEASRAQAAGQSAEKAG
jgi:hypothetical protein